jgi:hypothetical protein
VAKSKFPLLAHFANEVFVQCVQFFDGQLKWGVVVVGVLSVGFSIFHFRYSWDHVRDDLLGLLCSVLWVICVFAIFIVYRTARQLWREGGLPQQEERLIVLTDADSETQTPKLFHFICIGESAARKDSGDSGGRREEPKTGWTPQEGRTSLGNCQHC